MDRPDPAEILRAVSADLFSVRAADIVRLGLGMGRAFETDPVCRYVFPDADIRARRARYFYEFVMRTGLCVGEVYAPDAELAGVACWLPPGREHPGILDYLRAGALRATALCRPGAFWRINQIGDELEARHRRFAPRPHYYLSFLGVDPDFQGRGLASRLVLPMLARFDREGADCYLETHKASSIDIYKRFGFDLVDESPMEGMDMIQRSMLRRAR